MDYQKNVELALSLGFQEVLEESAFKGRYYIKDGVIWIHDIDRLKNRLEISDEKELARLGYDVESYYKYIKYSNEMVDREIGRIRAAVNGPDTVLSGRADIFGDSNLMKTMAGLSEEGFDDEVLADFAHQMSKD